MIGQWFGLQQFGGRYALARLVATATLQESHEAFVLRLLSKAVVLGLRLGLKKGLWLGVLGAWLGWHLGLGLGMQLVVAWLGLGLVGVIAPPSGGSKTLSASDNFHWVFGGQQLFLGSVNDSEQVLGHGWRCLLFFS